jgi:hypothetical protein
MEYLLKNYEKELLIGLLPLIGVVIGFVLTTLGNIFTKHKETKLKIIEKFIDKRLEAFEKLNTFINDLRAVDKYDITPTNEMHRYPIAFNAKENLTQLHLNLVALLSYSIWYSSELIKELNFVQDYFVTLQESIQDIPNENMKTVGMILWTDFISLSSNLDKMNKEFFIEEIANLKYVPCKTWHKYKQPETEKRLQSMKLMQSYEKIQLLKVGVGDTKK